MSNEAAVQRGPCEICNNDAVYLGGQNHMKRDCPRCGIYRFESTVANRLSPEWLRAESQDAMAKVRLSAWVREQNAAGIVAPLLERRHVRRIAVRTIPGLRERANSVLALIARKYPSLDCATDLRVLSGDQELAAVSYCRGEKDADVLLKILIDDGYVDAPRNSVNHAQTIGTITVKGMLAAEALGAGISESAQGFVAMSFAPELRSAYTHGFAPAIESAGFRPLRLDDKDYQGGISDQIIAEIRRSKFVITDYTRQINGVYFEAGFALGLGITVIPTCQEDELSKIHFDVRHLNTLLWRQPQDLATAMARRIRAVIGAGPLRNYDP